MEALDRLVDPLGGSRRVGGPSRKFVTERVHYGKFGKGWGTLPKVRDGSSTLWEVRDGSRDPRGSSGRVGGPSVRYGTGRGTLGDVRDGRPSRRSGMGRGTVGEVRDRSEDPIEGL